MIRSSRLAVGAALAAALVVTSVRAADPDKLLPADSDTVVAVNVRQIVESKIFEDFAAKQVKQALEGKDLKKLLTDLGLDPLKDIDKVVVGMQINGKNDTKYLMVVYGTFDPQKLFKAGEAATKTDADKFSMIKDGNTVIFKFQPENGDPPVYGTVISDSVVVAASDKKMITDAIAASKADKKPALKPDLAALVKKMDDKATVYAVSLVKGKFDGVNLPQNDFIDLSGVQKALPKIETISIVGRMSKEVNLEVTLGMKDDDAAADMKSAIEGVIGQIKPLAGLAGAGEIIDSVKTSLKNKDVTITGKATSDDLGKLMRQGKKK